MPIGYLFSDIERSTERWERAPERMRTAVERQYEIIEALVAKNGGVIHDRAGDGVFAIFASGNPLNCALDIQLAMQRGDWSGVGGLEIRLGVHLARSSNGSSVDQAAANRAARITASGWGGQIVVSGDAKAAYALPLGAGFVDLGVCHFKGIDEPLRLSGLIHPRLAKIKFPPLRSHLVQADIPKAATPFVGRERETGDLLAMLAEARLLTIVGPGGSGKTRQAAQIATALEETRPVAFVSLDTVSSEPDLVSAIAGALRFPLHGSDQPEKQLVDYLRDRHTLLVLDNADAIAGRASLVAELTRACARVTVLATSREPLRADGEVLYRLSGLSFAEAGSDKLNSPAYQLFALEAFAQGGTHAAERVSPQTFQEICKMVGGSPLALRLVARWSQLLSLEDMLEQLKTNSRFLADGANSTLRSVFEGSWRLLNAKQQTALARLSVFAGAFDWSAARGVGGVDLATYGALADKSLLDEDAQHRVSLHALIRGYAREKLSSTSDDEAAALRRHSDYYLDMVRAPIASTPGVQGAVLEQLHTEFPNIRAAWCYATAINSDRVRKAFVPLHHFLLARSLIREGIDLFSLDTSDAPTKALFEGARATCLAQFGDLRAAETAALRVFAGRGEPLARGFARHALGAIEHARGHYASARRHYERALVLWFQSGSVLNASSSAISLALLHFAHGQWQAAAQRTRQAFRLSREAGSTVGMLLAQMVAGDLAMREGRTDAARRNYEKALHLEVANPVPHLRASVLRRLGSLLLSVGDAASALRHHRAALDLATEAGEQRSQAHALVEIGVDLRALGNIDEARSSLLAGVRLALSLGVQPLVVQGLAALGRLDLHLGHRGHAERIVAALAARADGDRQSGFDDLVQELGGDPIGPSAALSIEAILDDIADEAEIGVLE